MSAPAQAASASAKPPKKPRQGRSPAFPFIALEKALERAETFRVAEGGRPKHYAPLTSAAKAWGIGPKTGLAIQTVAAMGHYGLFEFHGMGETRTARLTEAALNILLDKQPVSPERDDLIRQVALKPPIHKDLWQKWGDSLPSDATLETFLIRDKGFSENGARDLIEEYKSTIRFAKLAQPVNIPEEDGPEEGQSPPEGGIGRTPPPPPAQNKGQVKLMDSERVVFTEEGQPSQYLKLIASGEVDDFLLEALEDFVKRQRKRIKAAPPEP